MRQVVLPGILLALSQACSSAPPPKSAPLETRDLAMPVQGMKPSDMQDTFNQARDAHRHEATDIVAPRGTPVVAVEDGTVEKLFHSKPGGLTVYLFDPAREYCYYYAHLDGYEPHLKEGMQVKRGQVLGYVGTTGNAPPNSPHLHFGITVLGEKKKWWGGEPLDPYPILMQAAKRQGIRG